MLSSASVVPLLARSSLSAAKVGHTRKYDPHALYDITPTPLCRGEKNINALCVCVSVCLFVCHALRAQHALCAQHAIRAQHTPNNGPVSSHQFAAVSATSKSQVSFLKKTSVLG